MASYSPTAHIQGRYVATFASQHLQASLIFRDHLVSIEAQHAGEEFGAFFGIIRSYGSGCIMSAAAALEALINELFITAGSLRATLQDFDVEFWGSSARRGIEGLPILEKYQRALNLLGVALLDETAPVYADARWLIELRNALVHFKPIWDSERKRTIELSEALRDRFPLSPFVDTGADFVTMKCMSGGCANWAIAAVVSLVREFDVRANLSPKKISAFLRLGGDSSKRA